MNIRSYTYAVLITLIMTVCFVAGCEQIPNSHANTQMNIPPIQPGGGAKIGCGMIELME